MAQGPMCDLQVQRKVEEAQRAKAEAERLAGFNRIMERRFAKQEEAAVAKSRALQEQLKATKGGLGDKLMAIMGVTAAGAFTLNPASVAGRFSALAGAM